ncbi:CRAL/TRIO domain protein [Pseudohyphozyma bogoriensis]|nr:CRAL/TRIO domain protein [Pseudohyphozyma bogoriensis]
MVAGSANPLPTEGVVGHLNAEQTQKLKEFWKEFLRLIDEAPEEGSGSVDAPAPEADQTGDSIPKDDSAKERMKAEQESRDAKAAFAEFGSKKFLACFWRFVAMDDPDVIVLRFLRARKWSVSAGVAMLAACIRWRLTSDVEAIFEKGEEGMKNAEGFIRQMEIAKTYTQGTDRYGRPVIYIHVAKHRTFDQSAKALEDFVMFQMESNRCLFSPPVDKPRIEEQNLTSQCLEAYYPESLNVMLIHNAPWVFQGIWKLLAPMLDPVVRNKVQMTKTTDDLLVHIPPNHLIKQLGGSSEWKWKYPPIVPGENDPQKDVEGRRAAEAERDKRIAAYEAATRKWMVSKDASTEIPRKLATLEMRAQYYKLDPFIRGRGAYHRNGNILGNGLVSFEYPTPGEKSEGEWETSGYAHSMEACEAEAERLRGLLEAGAA